MSLFKKKSVWQRVSGMAATSDPKSVAKTGLTAVTAMTAMTVASAVVSAIRGRQERQ